MAVLIVIFHAIISLVYIVALPLSMHRIFRSVARSPPSLLLSAEDHTQLIILSKHARLLISMYMLSCGITHILSVYQLLMPSVQFESFALLACALTAMTSLGTAAFLLAKRSEIADLVSRLEIMSRGQAQQLAARSETVQEQCTTMAQEHTRYVQDRLEVVLEKHAQQQTAEAESATRQRAMQKTLEEVALAVESAKSKVEESKEEMAKKNRTVETLLKLALAEKWHSQPSPVAGRRTTVHAPPPNQPDVPPRPASFTQGSKSSEPGSSRDVAWMRLPIEQSGKAEPTGRPADDTLGHSH